MRAAVLILFLAACTSAQTLRGTGQPVEAHPGYVKLCAEHPEAEACREIR